MLQKELILDKKLGETPILPIDFEANGIIVLSDLKTHRRDILNIKISLERPNIILVVFQTVRQIDITKHNTKFDHCNI